MSDLEIRVAEAESRILELEDLLVEARSSSSYYKECYTRVSRDNSELLKLKDDYLERFTFSESKLMALRKENLELKKTVANHEKIVDDMLTQQFQTLSYDAPSLKAVSPAHPYQVSWSPPRSPRATPVGSPNSPSYWELLTQEDSVSQ